MNACMHGWVYDVRVVVAKTPNPYTCFALDLAENHRNGVKVKAFRRKSDGRLPTDDDELMLLARYLVLVAKRDGREGKGWDGLDHMDWKSELKRLG